MKEEILKQVEEIEKRLFEFQRREGYDTIFDLVGENLHAIKALVKREIDWNNDPRSRTEPIGLKHKPN